MLSITKVNVIQVCLADPQDGGLEQPSLPDVVVNIIFCCPDKGELPGPVVSPLNPTPVDAPVTVSGVNELITSGELPKKENFHCYINTHWMRGLKSTTKKDLLSMEKCICSMMNSRITMMS